MSKGDAGAFVRRWWFVGTALVGLTSWLTRLEGAVESKAPAQSVEQMQGTLNEIQNQLNDMAARQRAFFCRSQGDWCR